MASAEQLRRREHLLLKITLLECGFATPDSKGRRKRMAGKPKKKHVPKKKGLPLGKRWKRGL